MRARGNAAGVVFGDALPSAAEMQAIAAEVGYSETVFATRAHASDGVEDGMQAWRVRYFAPEQEIPFCGHATIALGAALALAHGDGTFALVLNDARITVDGWSVCDGRRPELGAALHSPASESTPLTGEPLARALTLFGLDASALDQGIPAAWMAAGARHLLLPLASRAQLAAMRYDRDAGRILMRAFDLATVCLAYVESPRVVHVRHAFAAGGVYEDPATGAGAAALAAHLRHCGWTHSDPIEFRQGEDMGVPCRLWAQLPASPGDGVRVWGAVRRLDQ